MNEIIDHDEEIVVQRVKGSASPRRSARTASDGGAAKASAPRRRAPRARTGSTPPEPNLEGVLSDKRLREVTSVVVLLAALLLLLALVSYTPHDQANADLRVRDLGMVLRNDPSLAARADTTENWLGLIGAWIANALYNGTAGYAMLALPVLMALWGLALFNGNGYRRVGRLTLYVLGAAILIGAFFGTMQGVSWMFHPSNEWSGAIGLFLASALGRLVGSAGAFLVITVSLFLLILFATNSDVPTALARLQHYWKVAREWGTAAYARLYRVLRGTEGSDEGSNLPGSPALAAAGGGATRIVHDTPADDEPARMVRRMHRTIGEERAPARIERSIPLPDDLPARTPAAPAMPSINRTVPAPEPASPVHAQERPAKYIPEPNEQPIPFGTAEVPPPAPATPPPAHTAPERVQGEEPIIERGAPPPPPPSNAAVHRLTLNVLDAETDADQEVAAAGRLIEKMKDEEINYVPPSITLLTPQSEHEEVNDEELKENGRILQEKLATFNIQIENLTVTPGPVVTLYEFVPAAGIKVAQIENLADDIALAMKARGIRIIAPIPGKGTVGVEIPNNKPATVRLRSVINTAKFREGEFRLPIALGKTTVGEVYCDDLAKMPHLLIAGATGSGKSVGVNTLVASLLYRMHPRDLKFLMIDPKKIELAHYTSLENHYLVRCPDIDEQIITNPQNAVLALKSLELEMDRRYDILARVRQRNLVDYNTKVEDGAYSAVQDFDHRKLPYIVVILDELADLMITASREVEEPIARLAQLARAVGIHLVVATQRPSVDVITGMIKANFPARIAYQVATKVDSRTILDVMGADQLLGNGDMLYLPGGMPKPLRLQNAYISTDEVEAICEHIGRQRGYSVPYTLPSVIDKARKDGGGGGGRNEQDELFEEAARLVVRHQQGSVSLVQRRLKVGYSRAARIIDELEMAGVVGPFDGSKARAVLFDTEEELEEYLGG